MYNVNRTGDITHPCSRVGTDGVRSCGSKAHTLESTSEELLNPQDDVGVQGHGHHLLHHQVRLDGVKCTREVHHEHPSVVTPRVQMLVQIRISLRIRISLFQDIQTLTYKEQNEA